MIFMPEETEVRKPLNLEIAINDEDHSVMVRFTGFTSSEHAEEYIAFLIDTLPLLLHEADAIH